MFCSALVLKSIRNRSTLKEPCKELLILEDLFLVSHLTLSAQPQVFPGKMTSPSTFCRRSWREFPTPVGHPSPILHPPRPIPCSKRPIYSDLCNFGECSSKVTSSAVLSGPNSTCPITTTVPSWGHHHLLARTMWITWSLRPLSLQWTCRQPPWTHTCTIR